MKMNSRFKCEQLSEYLDYLQENGEYWFFGSSIQEKLGLSDGALRAALWRLGKKKRLCRIRDDFYVIIPVEHRSAGCLPAQWFIDPLMKHFNLPYYVALQSAASIHGAAHQQVMMLQVMTDKPFRKIIAGNQHIHFYCKSNIEEVGVLQSKTPMSHFKLSSPELTVFDLVRYANSFEKLQQAATVIYELAEKIVPARLAKLFDKSNISVTVAQRLGYILDQVIDTELDLSALEFIIAAKKPRYILLTSGKKDQAYEKNKRWHILVNAQLELDEL